MMGAAPCPAPGHQARPALIEVDQVVKRFGTFEAVKGITFQVAQGEILGLLGPNGAGKSTLIRMMTALIPLSEGQVRIDGHSVTTEPDAVRRSIGVLPQAMTSDVDLTVEENLSIYAKLYGLNAQARKQNLEYLLEAVDLLAWRKAYVKTLSGGMRRRMEIARGLMHDPKVFFLDEPTTGLDPVSRVKVWDLLKRLNQERNITMLMSTHYMDEADCLCDRVAIVDHGSLIALDTPERLKANLPGGTLIEASFRTVPEGLVAMMEALPDVAFLAGLAEEGRFQFRTANGSRTITELIGQSVHLGAELTSISVKTTSLDDVFVHYTGRGMEARKAEAAQDPAAAPSGGRS
jgi:ABC-2 type transport system ATP-binding protein